MECGAGVGTSAHPGLYCSIRVAEDRPRGRPLWPCLSSRKPVAASRQARNGFVVLIRRELPDDIDVIRSVTAAAFRDAAHRAPPVEASSDPGEATLVSWLRADVDWVPELSMVAVEDGVVVGHVVCTRAYVDDRPALGLGPVSVLPHRQRSGIGSALMHAVLGAADALDERLVGLLGDPAYYRRFGFVPAGSVAVSAPDASWGDYFQVRTLTHYDGQTGRFRYAAPFGRL
jgi:putative acetyltransferase